MGEAGNFIKLYADRPPKVCEKLILEIKQQKRAKYFKILKDC
jgi:hypothetical protein